MPPSSSNYSPLPPAETDSRPDYSFLNEQQTSSSRFNLRPTSFLSKIVFLGIGLIVIVVIVIIIKNLLTTSPFSKVAYETVVNEQQQIIHILSSDVNQNNFGELSPVNQNFVGSCQLSVASAQSSLLGYLKTHGIKADPKILAAAYDKSLDTELSQSLNANNFSQTFSSIMNTQLSIYKRDLNTAYISSRGSVGRTMLKADYAGAQLLIKALSTPSS